MPAHGPAWADQHQPEVGRSGPPDRWPEAAEGGRYEVSGNAGSRTGRCGAKVTGIAHGSAASTPRGDGDKTRDSGVPRLTDSSKRAVYCRRSTCCRGGERPSTASGALRIPVVTVVDGVADGDEPKQVVEGRWRVGGGLVAGSERPHPVSRSTADRCASVWLVARGWAGHASSMATAVATVLGMSAAGAWTVIAVSSINEDRTDGLERPWPSNGAGAGLAPACDRRTD